MAGGPRPAAGEGSEAAVHNAALSPVTVRQWQAGFTAAALVERQERSAAGAAQRATELALAWIEELDLLGRSTSPPSAERERSVAAVREIWATLRVRMRR